MIMIINMCLKGDNKFFKFKSFFYYNQIGVIFFKNVHPFCNHKRINNVGRVEIVLLLEMSYYHAFSFRYENMYNIFL